MAPGTLGRASGSPPWSIVPLVFHEHVPSSNKVWWGGPRSQGPAGRVLCRCQGSSRAMHTRVSMKEPEESDLLVVKHWKEMHSLQRKRR